MIILTILALMTVPWAFGLVSSLTGFASYLLVIAALAVTAHFITLFTVTIQRAQLSRRAA
jgi:hypothetical protein